MIMNEIVFKYGSRFSLLLQQTQGRIQNFKLGGGAIKKFAPSGGRRRKFWGISCEKSQFYAKKIIFFPIAEGGAKIFGVFRVKNHDFMPKNHIFSNRSAPETNPMYDPLYSWE
jgi:hypothetical protein